MDPLTATVVVTFAEAKNLLLFFGDFSCFIAAVSATSIERSAAATEAWQRQQPLAKVPD